MNTYASDRPRKKVAVLVFLFLFLLAAALGAAYFVMRPRLESQPPRITVKPDSDVLGTLPVEVHVIDEGSGLKSVTATLVMGGSEQTLVGEQYSPAQREKAIRISLPKIAGVKEGQAILRVRARDASLWHFFAGNEAVLEKTFTVDLTPPTVELIADDRYVNFGGVGALVYKVSADTVRSGVAIGEHFFPGFAGAIQGHPDRHFALFAHPYDAPAQARPSLVATDKAGNTRELRVSYELKNVRYRESTIPISDNFLDNKVAPLLRDGSAAGKAPKEVFIAVNRAMRKENEDRILEITRKATPKLLWKGAFSQLSNSKVEANFADKRTYVYNGEPIDTAYHLGYDLSVTRQYPVEAANAGIVAFTGDLGIYGNTVILDHGFGLYTLYSHLSSIGVKTGDTVASRQVLGKTGETGLAAGDHLHYGVYLSGVAVLPVEWWDAKWIRDNIEPKLGGGDSTSIAESQPLPRRAVPAKRRR